MTGRLAITHIDTACVLIEINGFRILTDPTLDHHGGWYYHGSGGFSRKTGDPAFPAGGLEGVDLVLLSHHQHKDNLDTTGRAFLHRVPLVLTTKKAATIFSNSVGLNDWDRFFVQTALVPGLTVTATPAQHHPWWVPSVLAGKVIGFVLEWESQKNGVFYISGDTVLFQGIAEVANRFKVDIGVFHVGAVQFRYLTGPGKYTMDGAELVKAAHLLRPNKVVPVHHKGWSHFQESETKLQAVIANDSYVRQKTVFLQPGVPAFFE